MSVYAATAVSASVAYGEDFSFVQDQFKTVPYDYRFTILEQNDDTIFWSLTQSFDGVAAVETYTTYGTGTLRDGRLDLVGTGKFAATIPLTPSLEVEADFVVTQNITGRVGHRHARLRVQETGTLNKVVVEGETITSLIATYSLDTAAFCADRVLLQ
ncbi:hypothetical protein EBZ80_10345 [bacterium]|nr:hypothetical protein [bacterium]